MYFTTVSGKINHILKHHFIGFVWYILAEIGISIKENEEWDLMLSIYNWTDTVNTYQN